MTPEQVFNIANVVAIAGWLALVFFPFRRWAVEGVARTLVPALLAIAYAVLIAPFVAGGGLATLASFDSIVNSLGQPWLFVAGWLHYLAFDLLVGSWEVSTAREEGIPHWAVIPCLVFTFMLGPVGFLLFLLVRWRLGRRW